MSQKRLMLFVILLVQLFISCSSRPSREYKEFVETYGSDTRVFCDKMFLMRESFMSPQATQPQLYLINSQECK